METQSNFPIKDEQGNDYKPFGNNYIPFGGKCQDCSHTSSTYEEWANHITTEHNINYKKDPDAFMGRKKE